jgi:hypothetical protein
MDSMLWAAIHWQMAALAAAFEVNRGIVQNLRGGGGGLYRYFLGGFFGNKPLEKRAFMVLYIQPVTNVNY